MSIWLTGKPCTSRNEDEVSLFVNLVLICSTSGSFLQREDMHAQSMRVLNPPRELPIGPFIAWLREENIGVSLSVLTEYAFVD